MPLNPELASYLAERRTTGSSNSLAALVSVEEARSRFAAAAAAEESDEPEHIHDVTELSIPSQSGSLRARLYRGVRASTPLPILLYFHGGGWVVGSLQTHDGVCRALARRAECIVVSVDYRLAPENRFPSAVNDAWDATIWVASNAASIGAHPGSIAVGGDSAGGNLAAVIARRARDFGLPLRLQLLFYPITDRKLDRQSYLEFGQGYGLSRADMGWYWDQYLSSDSLASDPDASPLRAADLTGIAPAVIITAQFDVLRDEGEAYAERLSLARVPTKLRRYEGAIHGFIRMRGITSLADVALNQSADDLARSFSASCSRIDD